MKIKVRGVTYNSVKEASKALGVTIDGVYSALERGGLESLGLGQTKPKPVTLQGISFRSMTAASIALGLGRSYLREVILYGGPKARERVEFAAMRYAAMVEMEKARDEGGKITSCSATPDSRSEEQPEDLSES
jgi:hypothetical protein